ncbi:flippase-like domain-containing protein [Amycolatopsis sp. NBC_01488]|uniref:lysylphosphatidylglycerol synthase transmembrane domain-containing protein n=1 Tax=Amycolatopsis sp. NBC_01488 TaxID=2903563 RepID=UPI002E2CF230|nr:lysylphosphatidylglycerol synthase transmembrane domain-containing protein [Amycolatopsis sp. NBC_01488]
MDTVDGARRSRRRWVRPVAGTVVAGVLVVAAVTHPSVVTATLRVLVAVRPGWLTAAVLVEVVSVLGIAQLHRVLLGAAGATRPRTGDYLAVTYVGGAVSSSLPGGPALAIAYVYRQLRARGVAEASAAWALVVAGAVSTATIALVGGTVLTLAGHLTAVTVVLGAAEVAAVPGLIALVRWAARHPRPVIRFASAVLGRFNLLRRRPVHTGRERVVAAASTLNGIRPAWRHWLGAVSWSAVNWCADAACLALCLLAVGAALPSPGALVLAYVAGVVTTTLAVTPAGLGTTEAAITTVLVAHGSPAQPALAAVLLFRLLSPGLNTAVGTAIAAIRRSPGPDRPARQPVREGLGTGGGDPERDRVGGVGT